MTQKIKIEKYQKFGMLSYISEGDYFIQPSGQKQRGVIVKCDCGTIKNVRYQHLKRGFTISCGCIQHNRYDESKTKLYKKYNAIRYRCEERYFQRERYFDRGIKVCEEWLNSYESFRDWALQNGYDDNLSIDRIDNNKGYSPDNCRFVTDIINANNKEKTIYIVYKGQKKALSLVLREVGLFEHYNTILNRIKRGWDHSKAVNTNIKKGNYFKGKRAHGIKDNLQQ